MGSGVTHDTFAHKHGGTGSVERADQCGRGLEPVRSNQRQTRAARRARGHNTAVGSTDNQLYDSDEAQNDHFASIYT